MAQQTVGFGRRNTIAHPMHREVRRAAVVTATVGGASLPSRSAYDAPRAAASVPLQDGIAPFSSAGANSDARSADEVTMMRFIGANWPKYRDMWLEMRESGGALKFGFSPAAFFLGELWLLYRKQYALAFGLMAVKIALSFIVPKTISSMVMIGACVALGMYGKSFVVSRAMSTIGHIKALQLSPELEVRRIEKAGGTSWLAVTMLFVLFFIAGAISAADRMSKAQKGTLDPQDARKIEKLLRRS